MKEEKDKASGGKRESERTPKEKKEKSHRERRGSRHKRREEAEAPREEKEASEDSAFNPEEKALRSTAPKAACSVKPENPTGQENTGTGEVENEFSEAEVGTEEGLADLDEREGRRSVSPRSGSYKDRKRSRRTRSRSRRRRRSEEEEERRERDKSSSQHRDEVERARGGYSSSARPVDSWTSRNTLPTRRGGEQVLNGPEEKTSRPR